MQAIVGAVLFILVCVMGVIFGIAQTEKVEGPLKIGWVLLYSVGGVVGVYVAFALLGVVLWILLWFEIFIRVILQWLIGALLYPWSWVF